MWRHKKDVGIGFFVRILASSGVELKYLIAALLMIVVPLSGHGQGAPSLPPTQGGSAVLNDTSRMLYGPETVRWISEQDIFVGKDYDYRALDTAVRNYHYWTYPQRFNNLYKDLGNIGTALYPIYPQLPLDIGVTTGFDAYTPYLETQHPVYFNTKSPYTKLQLVWAGQGRAMTDIKFSRNINPRWNFGIDFRALLIDKQIQRQRKGDLQTDSYYYDAHMSYRVPSNRYQVMFYFRRIHHVVAENGGVIVGADAEDPYIAVFNPNVQPKLTTAKSEELYSQLHVFQQYILIPNKMDLYYQLDVTEELNAYKDSDIGAAAPDVYDATRPLDSATSDVYDRTNLLYWRHRIGAKGYIGRFFHDAYVKIRPYDFTYRHLRADTLSLPMRHVEYYMGGRFAYEHDSLNRVEGWGEVLLGDTYKVGMDLRTKWVDIHVRHILSKPPFLYNSYRGAFDFWNNRFENRGATQVKAFAKVSAIKKRFFLAAGATLVDLHNYIYFEQDLSVSDTEQTVLPYQSKGRQTLLLPEARLALQLPFHIYLNARVIYANPIQNDDNAIRVPTFFANGQLSYQNKWFKKHLDVHLGVDVHWKSEYFDTAYDPAIQQFYLQDSVLTPSYFLLDVFFSGKIKRGRFFLRYHNFLQIFNESGYLATPPSYPGQRNILDFGFELMLFD